MSPRDLIDKTDFSTPAKSQLIRGNENSLAPVESCQDDPSTSAFYGSGTRERCRAREQRVEVEETLGRKKRADDSAKRRLKSKGRHHEIAESSSRTRAILAPG